MRKPVNMKKSPMNQRFILLAALLPFGVGYKDIAALWFSDTRNGNRAINAMIAQGLLEEHVLKVSSPRRNYYRPYLALTLKGLQYLAEEYPHFYPWLPEAVELLSRSDSCSFVRGLSVGTLRSELTAQACNAIFTRSGAATYIARLVAEPEKALTVMATQYATTKAGETAFGALYLAYCAWLDRMHKKHGRPVRSARYQITKHVHFFDCIELKIPDFTPYRMAGLTAQIESPAVSEKRERMAGHVGILQAGNTPYIVFQSSRDGATWNSTLIRKNSSCFTQQAIRLGILKNASEAPFVFPSIMLIFGKGGMGYAFARMARDPCELRSRRDRRIGRGTSVLHAVPVVRESFDFLKTLFQGAKSTDYRMNWADSLLKSFPELFSKATPEAPYPLLFESDLPCYCAVDLDMLLLNRADEEENCVVVCLPWQARYVHGAAPDARIVSADLEQGYLYEWHF